MSTTRGDSTQSTPNRYAVCPNILRLSGVDDRGLVIASPVVDVELGGLPSSDRFGGIVNFELARAEAGCILFDSGKNDEVTKTPYGTDLSEVAQEGNRAEFPEALLYHCRAGKKKPICIEAAEIVFLQYPSEVLAHLRLRMEAVPQQSRMEVHGARSHGLGLYAETIALEHLDRGIPAVVGLGLLLVDQRWV